MKTFKQLFAVIFTAAVVVFGVFVIIDEKDLFTSVSQLSFEGWAAAKITIAYILLILADVGLIALPALGFILVLLGKYDPFKAIANAALAMLLKFVLSIIAAIIVAATLVESMGYSFNWNEVFFGKDSMLIIPTLVFGLAIITIILAKASGFAKTLGRPVLTLIGSGLAIFGLVYYFGIGGGTGGIFNGGSKDWIDYVGLILGIACFGGLAVYCFLPQVREAK